MPEQPLATWALATGVAFLITLGVTPVLIRIAPRFGWVAQPKADRWHSRPTALMGGIAIFIGATGAGLLTAPSALPWPVWVGAALMFATGFADDLVQLRPASKLVAQVLAAALLVGAGYMFGPSWPLWISVPVTFLWVIGITNAVNLLDNMDGLSAGITGIVALTLATFLILSGQTTEALFALVLAGACAAFLLYNFNPARIFMGDCGSLFIGYGVAALAVVAQGGSVESHPAAAAVISVAVLALPILDTTLVTLLRKWSGRPVSQGGRDHSSHRLVFMGLSEREAVLMLYAVSAVGGGAGLLFLFTQPTLFYSLVVLAGVGLAVFGIHLASADVYERNGTGLTVPPEGRLFSALHTFMGGRSWKAVVGMLTDLLLVAASFVIAYHLRFESDLTAGQLDLLLAALPVVVAVKIVVFWAAGLYENMWRHAGTPEVVRLAFATMVASLATAAALAVSVGLDALSLAALFIDWIVVTAALIAVRFAFRGLRQYASARRRHGRHVLLYGAGEAGLLSLRELRQNPDLKMNPVGFLDDDPHKQGFRVQGLRVLGGIGSLAEACKKLEVKEVLIVAPKMPLDRKDEIVRACAEAGVDCSAFAVRFEPLHMNAPPQAPPEIAEPVVG